MEDKQKELTILIADDDQDIRGLVASAIVSTGAKVLEAFDGEHAVELFDLMQPDLAVLDFMMPNMDGKEVCQHIKASEAGELVPVIMLTARGAVEDKVNLLDAGADDYMTKPFDYQELQARVRAQLRVRELNLQLQEKNRELQEMQQKIVEHERQMVALELAGAAAHELGQPLSAIMLNCHLIESLGADDQKYKQALSSIKHDAKRIADLVEKLKKVDTKQKRAYYGDTEILDLSK